MYFCLDAKVPKGQACLQRQGADLFGQLFAATGKISIVSKENLRFLSVNRRIEITKSMDVGVRFSKKTIRADP